MPGVKHEPGIAFSIEELFEAIGIGLIRFLGRGKAVDPPIYGSSFHLALDHF